jgi:general secretion pathway protein E
VTHSPSFSLGALQQQLAALNAADTSYATRFVDLLLSGARLAGASDVHLQPASDGLQLRWRLDGVLQQLGTFSRGEAADVVTRLKVMAELLTYRTDVPQEGRIRERDSVVEMRVSTFPTLHGERAVVRLFAPQGHLLYPEQLGLPPDVLEPFLQVLSETSGAILASGPAGSGKTTTVYAALRELVRRSAGGKSIVSLEDPIEVAVDGVAQSQVNEPAGFGLATGLRSLMRQDPEVILVGEIRDRTTAETAFQASLTGHLVLTTFHAGSAAGVVSRLSDMGIEPYLLRSGLLAILNQRLVRRLCSCARPARDAAESLGLLVERASLPVGCPQCLGTGYRGRIVLAELFRAEASELGRAILSRSDAAQLEQLAVQAGMVTRWQRAAAAVAAGLTSPAEIRRVLGFTGGNPAPDP